MAIEHANGHEDMLNRNKINCHINEIKPNLFNSFQFNSMQINASQVVSNQVKLSLIKAN